MARPARVRMRSRKPWVLARRRVFGWKVRLLTTGSLSSGQGTRLLGMVTDRDITVRGVAAGLSSDVACVAEVMTKDLEFCTEDQDTEEVMHTMGYAQVRRLPVVNMDGGLVGIVSLGDMARRQPGPVDQTVRDISEPSALGSV